MREDRAEPTVVGSPSASSTVPMVGRPALPAAALALLLAVAGWMLQLHGGDLAAQLHRAALVARDGFVLWDASWFGGHLTPGYSVLHPLLAAPLGVWPLAVASAVVAAWAFDSVLRRHAPAVGAAPGLWFAAGTVVNLAVGRLAFALGLAVGLLAVLAASRRMLVLAGVLSLLTPLASPVAGAFLALAWTAQAVVSRRFGLLGLAFLTVVPVAVTTALFPRGGDFPFGPGALVVTLVACALVGWVVTPVAPAVRVGAALYGATAVVAFVLDSPAGANVTRLGMFFAWPLLVAGYRSDGLTLPFRELPAALAAQWRRRSRGEGLRPLLASPAGRSGLVLVAAPLLLTWQWTPALDGLVRAADDPSLEASFHQPLVEFLDAQGGDPFRVEVVPLARHGESVHVAEHHALARGWDRQLDRRHHQLFYGGTLTEAEYRAWLAREGVRFVALAAAPLDRAGRAEAALLEAGVAGLRPVLVTASWRVWEVQRSAGLVDGPARLVTVRSDEVVLDAYGTGSTVVRIRADGRWTVDGPACLLPATEEGWLRLQVRRPGRIDLAPATLEVAGPGCEDGAGAPAHQPRRSISHVATTSSPLTT